MHISITQRKTVLLYNTYNTVLLYVRSVRMFKM